MLKKNFKLYKQVRVYFFVNYERASAEFKMELLQNRMQGKLCKVPIY